MPFVRAYFASACLLAAFSLPARAAAPAPNVLHTFGGAPDASFVEHGVVIDAQGELYGSSRTGGPSNGGTIFQLTPPAAGKTQWGSRVILDYIATGLSGGPLSGVDLGADGSVIGTSVAGGAAGAGDVFRLSPPKGAGNDWTLHPLVDFFANGDHGVFPEGVPRAATGKQVRFGTTIAGGSFGLGNAYRMTPPQDKGALWSTQTLHTFDTGDGIPLGELVADAAGNLYGVTNADPQGHGTLYRLLKPGQGAGEWAFQALHVFTGGADGADPVPSLTIDSHGVLWGAASGGGSAGAGTLFRLAPSAGDGVAPSFAVVHSFDGAAGGAVPQSRLVPDGKGGLIGSTVLGGAQGCGNLFRFQPATGGRPAAFNKLAEFPGGNGGGFPMGDLAVQAGVLYGATVGSSGFVNSPACVNPASVAFSLTL